MSSKSLFLSVNPIPNQVGPMLASHVPHAAGAIGGVWRGERGRAGPPLLVLGVAVAHVQVGVCRGGERWRGLVGGRVRSPEGGGGGRERGRALGGLAWGRGGGAGGAVGLHGVAAGAWGRRGFWSGVGARQRIQHVAKQAVVTLQESCQINATIRAFSRKN